MLGGLIVEYAGSRGGFLWDAATFFVRAGSLIFSMSALRQPYKPVDPRSILLAGKEIIAVQKNVWTEIKEGVAISVSVP